VESKNLEKKMAKIDSSKANIVRMEKNIDEMKKKIREDSIQTRRCHACGARQMNGDRLVLFVCLCALVLMIAGWI